jgi:hypothetical protein
MRALEGLTDEECLWIWGTGCGFLVATSLSDMNSIQKMVIKEDE